MKGIYIIKNKITQQVYVGQSKNFIKRKARHLLNYRENKFKSYNKLYPAMNKYGLENFEFIFIEECSDEMLDEREAYWITFYNSIDNGYNFNFAKNNRLRYWLGKKRDKETKLKISKSLTGRQMQGEVKRKIGSANSKSMIGNTNGNKKILCIELNKVFDSVKEAAEFVGVHPSNISKCLKGVQRTAGKYSWKYLLSSLETIPNGSTVEDELPLEVQEFSMRT